VKTTVAQQQNPPPGVWPVKPATPSQRIPITGKPMREENVPITFAPGKKGKANSKMPAAPGRAKIKARS